MPYKWCESSSFNKVRSNNKHRTQFPDLTQHGMFLTDQLPTWPNSHDLTILFTWNSQFASLREGGVWGKGEWELFVQQHILRINILDINGNEMWLVMAESRACSVLSSQVISLWHCCARQYSVTNLPNVAATLMTLQLRVRRAAISNVSPDNQFIAIYLSSSGTCIYCVL
jgi:hypothetical protein